MSVSRRSFLSTTPIALVPAFWGQTPSAPAQAPAAPPPTPLPARSADTFPSHGPDLAREMVGASHVNLPRVKELLVRYPTLARASWDWGFGDWEDALGAASHVGNREIAALLLANGARPTIFSAAMLGHLDVVKSFIAASPGIEATPGPHSIPLFSHATAGGPQSQPVADYLKTLPGANKRPDTQPLTPEDAQKLVGEYVYGLGTDERISITLNSTGALTFTRSGRNGIRLNHVGDMAFYPPGAPLVRIRFTASTLTVHDPGLVVEAKRT